MTRIHPKPQVFAELHLKIESSFRFKSCLSTEQNSFLPSMSFGQDPVFQISYLQKKEKFKATFYSRHLKSYLALFHGTTKMEHKLQGDAEASNLFFY